MPEAAWEKGFLMPELPAKQPWERCLYCSSFDLWQGTLAVCGKRRMVLSPKAHYDRKCNSWAPNAYCKVKPDWMAEPAAEIVAGTPEFLCSAAVAAGAASVIASMAISAWGRAIQLPVLLNR